MPRCAATRATSAGTPAWPAGIRGRSRAYFASCSGVPVSSAVLIQPGEIAQRRPLAPVIAYVPEGRISPPSGHMRFPGTISVPEETFERVLESAGRSFRQHGFRDVVFLGDHGSTQAGQRTVATRLNREWAAAPTRAHAIEEYYRASQAEFARALRVRGFSEAEIGTHAGLADTALMLAIDARLVRADRLRPGTGEAGDGVDGDPRRATAELGRAGADDVVAKTVEAVKQALARR